MRLLRWVGQLLFFLSVASKMGAQAPSQLLEYIPAIRFGVVSPEVREQLAQDWDRHQYDDPYLERGFCGYIELGKWGGELAYIVTRVTQPDTVIGQPTNGGIQFQCKAWNSVPIHVHPPRNCPTKNGPCTKDGPYAYQCLASDTDRQMLNYFDFVFGVVQCERKALVTYWPVGVAGA